MWGFNCKPSTIFLLLGLAVLDLGPTEAQTLPEGQHQANRERTYDVLHYSADLELNFANKSVSGTATIELNPLREIASVTLDAIQLDIEAVKLNGKSIEFSADGHRLNVALPTPAEPGQTLSLEVRYRARPRAGMYFQADPAGSGKQIVVTYGEGGTHANWLPIYNDVNDRFTSEMRITVPEPYSAISNGTLIENTKAANGRTVWHWKQEKPHPNYLIAVYAGDFERGELPPAFGTIPLAYWVPRGQLADGAYGFRNTGRMVEFYSTLFDFRYPWVKYDQIAVPDYPIGAMEHTGVTGHDAGVLRSGKNVENGPPDDFGPPTLDQFHTDWTAEATISHELAHHWFGNMLTCRNLSQLWLNESFASYLMILWAEELYGDDQLLFDVDLARRHYLAYSAKEHSIRPLEYAFFDSPNDIYTMEHTYFKGAAVLHMLRSVLGDPSFFGALGYYLDKHAFSNVESHDLKIAIEESTGRNLDWFFGDWITGAGHPVFEVDSRWLEDRKQIDLRIRQVQSNVPGQDTFRLPVTIRIATNDRSWETTIEVDAAEDRFLIPCETKPVSIDVDPRGNLVAEIRFDKPLEEWIQLAGNSALIGRIRALEQLAASYPTEDATLAAFDRILSDPESFWGLRASAAQLLGQLRTPAAAVLADKTLKIADYRVRKAAVLGLPGFGGRTAAERLRRIVHDDPHSDVVAAAILALAKTDPGTDAAFLQQQLGRDAWYDEIRLAVMLAIKELGQRGERPELLAIARSYVELPYNMAVRQAALDAWAELAPRDPKLHRALQAAAQEPPYPLQQFSIEQLGKLYVTEAVPFLKEMVQLELDANLTQLADIALKEIERIRGDDKR